MTEDEQPDTRSSSEKRIDARREAKGLPPGKPNFIRDHLIIAVLLIGLGAVFVHGGTGIGAVLAIVCFAGSLYNLIVAGVAQGAKISRD